MFRSLLEMDSLKRKAFCKLHHRLIEVQGLRNVFVARGRRLIVARYCTSGGWSADVHLEFNVIHGECIPFESDSLDFGS
jgi:hypothetical protein